MKTFFTTIIILLFGLTSFAGVKSELKYELPSLRQHGMAVTKMPVAKLNTAETTKLAKKSAARTSDNWKSLGMGTFREFVLSSLYPELFAPEDYQVEIQQNVDDSRVYRIVNPYKNLDTTKYGGIKFDETDNYDIYFHIEIVDGEKYVWVEDFDTGIILESYGIIQVDSQAFGFMVNQDKDIITGIINAGITNIFGSYDEEKGLIKYPTFTEHESQDYFNFLITGGYVDYYVDGANRSASPFLVVMPGHDVPRIKDKYEVYKYLGKGTFLNNILAPINKLQSTEPLNVEFYLDADFDDRLHVRYAWSNGPSSNNNDIDFIIGASNPECLHIFMTTSDLFDASSGNINYINSYNNTVDGSDDEFINKYGQYNIFVDFKQKRIVFPKESVLLGVSNGLGDEIEYLSMDEDFMFESYMTLPDEVLDALMQVYDNYGLEFGYNGRYMEISHDTPGATVEYCFDNPDNEWIPYSKGFDVGGLKRIFAKIKLPEYRSSIYTYTPSGYADMNHIEISQKGHNEFGSSAIEKLYGWAGSETLGKIEELRINGQMNYEDYNWICKNMRNLRHLDLSEVTDSVVPEGALKSERLLSVVMPEGVKELGADVFGNGNRTLCAIEWPADRVAPDNLLEGVENPNLLLYVNSLNYVSGLRENDVNVVSGQRSRLVRLTDGMPFFAPKEFTADDISFTREFSKRTALEGGTAGWETIVLPFEVQTVAHSKGELMPFAKKDGTSGYGGLRYWLFGADVSGWVPADKQEANVPYLIAMPNNEYYYDEYILGGEVTFSAKNASVAVTPANIGSDLGTNRFVGSLSRVESSGTVMAVNDNAYEYSGEDFAPGSVFVAGLRDVRPFEAYLEAASGSRQAYVRIFDTSDVGELFAETGMRVWTETGDVCICSGISRKVMVCDMMGRVVRIAEVSAGEVCRVHGLAPGIYIVGDVKIRL